MSETSGVDAFSTLGPEVRSALSERGFSTPTEPQRRAIPTLAAGHDALVIAPTGTGKTETAMLPVFDALAENPTKGFGALYITPLRALNRDMQERLDWWGETLGVDVAVRHGDTTQYQRTKQADDPPDVLITTPESVQAMLTGSKLRNALTDVQHVIVDEVHELAASKRGAQLSVALERVRELADDFQTIGLSATVGDPEEVGRFLTGDRGCDIVEVDVASKLELDVLEPDVTDEDSALGNELMTSPTMASHIRTILDIVDENDSTLIFVNTRQSAEALGSRFKKLEANIGVHHGSLSKEARIDVEESFKAGELDALLCTSSMELGIDVGRIDHVIQYQSPREVARILQRVGRAGHRRDMTSRGTIITGTADDTNEALAIARRALDGDVEDARIHHGSLDVVANQTVGLVMDQSEVRCRTAYRIITRAYPYRDLDEATYRSVIQELHRNHIIYLNEAEDTISKSGGTFSYYYSNLSMIPDEETYGVKDVASGRQIGTLDEKFVLNFAEPGATFIQRGDMWRVASVDDDEASVEVTPIEDPTGEVPSWVGQEIPVPFEVAQEVGHMRDVAGPQFETGAPSDSVSREFSTRYPANNDTATKAFQQLERHVETGAPVPTDTRLVVEQYGRDVVLNACFGHRANETIGRLVAALLGQETGTTVAIDTDPYRIEFELPGRLHAEDVIRVLEDTDPDHLKPLLELSLKKSEALGFTLSQVAAKFGSLKRWRSRGGQAMGVKRIMSALEDTPVYEEAIREVFHRDFDVERARNILQQIQDGDIDVTVHGERTPIGTDGRSSGKELLTPENADASVVDTVRERLKDDGVRLVCLHCTDWVQETKVRRVRDQPECPRCGSTRIAALSPWADDTVKALRQPPENRDDEQEDLVQRAYKNASIVQGHGKKAITALAARGVGPQNAARIINNHREDEADFYRDILEREREYARTKAFW